MTHTRRSVIWIMALSACAASPTVQQSATPQSADALVDNAVHQAANEHKAVIVVFGASWCPPCTEVDAFFKAADVHNAVSNNYLIRHLTIWERGERATLNTPGSEAMFNQIGGDGIPLIAFLDPSGRSRDVWNNGLPSDVNRAEFLRLFTENRPNLTAGDRALLLTDLKHALGVYSVSGRVVDAHGQPASGASVSVVSGAYTSSGQWAPRWGPRTKTDQAGGYNVEGLTAGEYQVVADSDAEGAVVSLALRAREDRSDVDIQLAPIRSTQIKGVAHGSSGQPVARRRITLTNLDRPMLTYSCLTGADGAFSFDEVRPGRYNAAFRITSPSTSPGTLVEAVLEPLLIVGSPLSAVKLTAKKAGTLSGVVTFDGGQMTTAQLSGVRIVAVVVEPEPGAPSEDVEVAVGSDRHFALHGLFGPRVLRVSGLPPVWKLESARINGDDATASPIDFTGLAPIDGAHIVLSTSPVRQH